MLDQVLGLHLAGCAAQTGPLPGSGSNPDASGGTSASAGAATPTTVAGAAGTSSPSSSATGPNSGLGGLSQLLSPLLQGIK